MNYFKELSITGQYRTVTAKIYVTMNYKREERTFTNPYTHNEMSKIISLHKVESFIDGVSWKVIENITNEDRLLSETEQLLNDTLGQISTLSNSKPSVSFEDKMNEILK